MDPLSRQMEVAQHQYDNQGPEDFEQQEDGEVNFEKDPDVERDERMGR